MFYFSFVIDNAKPTCLDFVNGNLQLDFIIVEVLIYFILT